MWANIEKANLENVGAFNQWYTKVVFIALLLLLARLIAVALRYTQFLINQRGR